MKIINQNGYTREELFSWRVIVYRNIVESAQALAQAIADFNMTFESPENAVKNLPGTWQENTSKFDWVKLGTCPENTGISGTGRSKI